MKIKPIIKSMLRWYYKPNAFYKVPFGPLKNQWMLYTADLNFDMLLGFHEPSTFEVFRQTIDRGMVAVDVGANRGYFSIFLNKLVGPRGRVIAFEPIPPTVDILRRTIERNQARQVDIHPYAVTDHTGPVTMYLSHSYYMSSTDPTWAGLDSGTTTVQGMTLDHFFSDKDFFPDFIKLDIEGGGVLALQGMRKTIVEHQPILFLESHTPQEDRAIGEALQWSSYDVYRVGTSQPIEHLDADYTDPLGVWGTVLGVPRARRQSLSRLNPAEFQKQRFGQRPSTP